MKDNVVVEEPKEAEKPSLVLTIGSGTSSTLSSKALISLVNSDAKAFRSAAASMDFA